MGERLKGSVSLVVGGSRSIGRAISSQFAREGSRVAVCSRRAVAEPEIVGQIRDNGGEALWVPADMADPEQLREAVAQVVERFGRLDILVVSGAPQGVQPDLFADMAPSQYSRTLESQFISRLNSLRVVLPVMRRQGYGKVVFITTDAGREPTPGESLVGSAAAALLFFVKAAGKELAGQGIRVNAIATTLTKDTDIHAQAARFGDDHVLTRAFAKIEKRTPFRMNVPGDIADAAVFLASKESDQISGAVLSVNGGLSFN